MPKSKTIDLAWAAGLFDGEGSIGVYARKSGWYVVAQLQMSHRPTCHRFAEVVGSGGLFRNKKRAGYKQAYRILVSARKAEKLLGLLLPFLVAKKREALLALRVRQRQGVPGRHHSHQEKEWFRRQALKMKALKRGH